MKVIKTILKRKLNWVALPLVVLFLITATFAPLLAPADPSTVDLEQKLSPPSHSHLLGTDHLGRDILSRLIWGARTSMGSVFLIINLVMITSLVVGSISGYIGGKVDSLFMRICEIFLTFPTFILAMFLIGVLGTGMTNVVLAIALTHWAWYARIIRSLVLSMKNREYILAAPGRRHESLADFRETPGSTGSGPACHPGHPGYRPYDAARFRAVVSGIGGSTAHA